uniref:WD_REPEATS_REGION domain-containing protein n=1 Tax=Macrostomum lignano TaxID=282301 RepID=A0A1I8F479_9PLAT
IRLISKRRSGIPTLRRRVPQRDRPRLSAHRLASRLAVEQPSRVGHVAKSGCAMSLAQPFQAEHILNIARDIVKKHMATSAAEPGASRSETRAHCRLHLPGVSGKLFQHRPERDSLQAHILAQEVRQKDGREDFESGWRKLPKCHLACSGCFHHRPERKTSAKEKPAASAVPICRETSGAEFEPDETIVEYLVKVLQEMRHQSRCSGAESCLTEATLQCPCCDKSASMRPSGRCCSWIQSGAETAHLQRGRRQALPVCFRKQNPEQNALRSVGLRGDDFEGLLAQHASSAVFQSPYEGLPPMLTRVRQQNLSQKPWDIAHPVQSGGHCLLRWAIKLRSSVGDSAGSAKELTGPLLVINAQCFPTKMLHVTDLEAPSHRVQPGGSHCDQLRRERLSKPRQFHSPLGLSAFGGQMFVVDAKNLRVQGCLALIKHDGFSNGLQSVLATDSSVFVVDRETVEDVRLQQSQQAVGAPPLKLECQPVRCGGRRPWQRIGDAGPRGQSAGSEQVRGTKLKTFEFKETAEGRQQMPDDFPMMMMMPMLMANGLPAQDVPRGWRLSRGQQTAVHCGLDAELRCGGAALTALTAAVTHLCTAYAKFLLKFSFCKLYN